MADVASGLEQTVDENLLLARDGEEAPPEELLELSILFVSYHDKPCRVVQSSSVDGRHHGACTRSEKEKRWCAKQ